MTMALHRITQTHIQINKHWVLSIPRNCAYIYTNNKRQCWTVCYCVGSFFAASQFSFYFQDMCKSENSVFFSLSSMHMWNCTTANSRQTRRIHTHIDNNFKIYCKLCISQWINTEFTKIQVIWASWNGIRLSALNEPSYIWGKIELVI